MYNNHVGNFLWDKTLARNLLDSGDIGNFNLPRRSQAPKRTRQNALLSDMEEVWPKLSSQLMTLVHQLQMDINAERETHAATYRTCQKLTATMKTYMVFLHKEKHVVDIGLEYILAGPYIKDWIVHCVGVRGISFTTMSDYLCAITTTIHGLRSMKIPIMGTSAVDKLLSDLQAVKRQINRKAKAQKNHDLMDYGIYMQRALNRRDPAELEKLPGSLKYGLSIEWATKMAEMWLQVRGRVFVRVGVEVTKAKVNYMTTNKMFFYLYQVSDKVSERTWLNEDLSITEQHNLCRLAKHLLCCWWRAIQIGVDMPPLRSSSMFSIYMPHSYHCPDTLCSTVGCHGNQVEVRGLREGGD